MEVVLDKKIPSRQKETPSCRSCEELELVVLWLLTNRKAWEKESTRITYHFRIDWAKAREIDSEEE
jgi:hypothetical protein